MNFKISKIQQWQQQQQQKQQKVEINSGWWVQQNVPQKPSSWSGAPAN